MLMEQRYSPEDDRRHMAYLATAFRDPRYLRIDGSLYSWCIAPDGSPSRWRPPRDFAEEARRLGVGDLYLACVESFPEERETRRQSDSTPPLNSNPTGHSSPKTCAADRYEYSARTVRSSD